MKKELYFVKLGGSVITDTQKPSTPRKAEISRLLGEIQVAREAKDFQIILGHGGGSFGHFPAKKYRINEGIINSDSMKGFVETQNAMHNLNMLITDAAIKAQLSPHPFTPSSFAYSSGKKIVGGTLEGIRNSLDAGSMPIVHGDGMSDSRQGISIASTEEVFRFLLSGIKPDKIIIGTDMDGVFDSDPRTNPSAKLIPVVDSSNIDAILSSSASGAQKVDVTGGMKTKLETLYGMVKSTGAQGYIANASKPRVIENLLMGNHVECTSVRL
ncbi:MAG: hypothetical protein KGH65_02990 [Candidatus Micrarchaeota archaeon]|nr:hypothetical protein [Candidatus Micrarchaeota archaeon]